MIYKEIGKVKEVGSCNFCRRGKLNKGVGVFFPYDYPYDEVNIITGEGSIVVRICNKCLEELKKL